MTFAETIVILFTGGFGGLLALMLVFWLEDRAHEPRYDTWHLKSCEPRKNEGGKCRCHCHYAVEDKEAKA